MELPRQNDPLNRNTHDDEIDLGFIYRKLKTGGSVLGKGLSYTGYVLSKRIKLISIVILVGMSFGYLLFATTLPQYKSTMILNPSRDVRNDFCEKIIEDLKQSVEEQNLLLLSQKLKVDKNFVKSIADIQYSLLVSETNSQDSILVGQPFVIELFLYNNNHFDTLEVALYNYLENFDFFLRRKIARQENLQNMVGKLYTEISSIDSVKKIVANPVGPINGFIFGEQIDPVEMYREGMVMFKNQQDLNYLLKLNRNFEIVNGFSTPLKPVSPSLNLYIINSIALSFLFSITLVLFLEKRSVTKDKEVAV
jgi:capsular polysaccharide biosynthesis protein